MECSFSDISTLAKMEIAILHFFSHLSFSENKKAEKKLQRFCEGGAFDAFCNADINRWQYILLLG
ncbi:hypothetical protein MA16_Dca014815 [Dendrobium catenatum]|uniref:Uncharacterized protein n=1 Tax=Dendrobium catenatum TaxID=906689 RepID=A0A2I0W6A0_9ASPA|nr:hypothetical protein MA16_Dca014815 [Dendrobium catenatum]